MAGEAFATDKPEGLGCVYSMPTIKGVFPLVRTSLCAAVAALCVFVCVCVSCVCVPTTIVKQPKLVVRHNVDFCWWWLWLKL
jgi:hypothetical protein